VAGDEGQVTLAGPGKPLQGVGERLLARVRNVLSPAPVLDQELAVDRDPELTHAVRRGVRVDEGEVDVGLVPPVTLDQLPGAAPQELVLARVGGHGDRPLEAGEQGLTGLREVLRPPAVQSSWV